MMQRYQTVKGRVKDEVKQRKDRLPPRHSAYAHVTRHAATTGVQTLAHYSLRGLRSGKAFLCVR